MRRCHVGMEARPTICDFTLTQTPIQRLKDIRANGGKIPQDLQLRLRALRLRKLRASTKAINRRREQQQQQQTRRARSTRARRAWAQTGRGLSDELDGGFFIPNWEKLTSQNNSRFQWNVKSMLKGIHPIKLFVSETFFVLTKKKVTFFDGIPRMYADLRTDINSVVSFILQLVFADYLQGDWLKMCVSWSDMWRFCPQTSLFVWAGP